MMRQSCCRSFTQKGVSRVARVDIVDRVARAARAHRVSRVDRIYRVAKTVLFINMCIMQWHLKKISMVD